MAVTTGLLDKLDREQLQGVIGHEMSHIGNLDIRFTLLVGVLVGAIALLADWFLRFTYWGGGRRSSSDSDRGGGGAAALIFALALILAIVAPLIGRLIQAAVSRSRESLADATAVELTRNPVGLARALRTISDDQEVLEVANRATQHLYIVNPIKSFEERAKSLWDTHPPIGERIRALEAIAGQMGTTRWHRWSRSPRRCELEGFAPSLRGSPRPTSRRSRVRIRLPMCLAMSMVGDRIAATRRLIGPADGELVAIAASHGAPVGSLQARERSHAAREVGCSRVSTTTTTTSRRCVRRPARLQLGRSALASSSRCGAR